MAAVLYRKIVEYITQDYYGAFVYIFVGEAFWGKIVKIYIFRYFLETVKARVKEVLGYLHLIVLKKEKCLRILSI